MVIPRYVLDKQLCSQCQKHLTVGPIKVYRNRQVRCGRCVKDNDNGVESKLFSTVMKGMVVPCINSLEGCSEELSIQEMKDHEEICIEHTFSCPICKKFEGSSYALNTHCEKFHKNKKLESMCFPINLDTQSKQHEYFYCKNNMLLFISCRHEVNQEDDINKIKINVSFTGHKYNGDVLQSVSLYTINHQLKYKTQIKPCSKLNSIDSTGFTIDVSHLIFPKDIVFCELNIFKKPILSLVEKQLVIDSALDNFIAKCKFDNISKVAEKIYFPAVYYFSDITWKVFINVVDKHVEVGLCWDKTNNTTLKLDLYGADVNLKLMLSSKKNLSKRLKQIRLKSSNVLKFNLGTVFNNTFIQNDSINIEVTVNIYLHTKTNEECKNACVHCKDECVHQGIKKSSGDDKWCKFDDDVDSRCTKQKGTEKHNAGHEEDMTYMLAFIKDLELPNVPEKADIRIKLAEEKGIEQVRQKERDNAQLPMTVSVTKADIPSKLTEEKCIDEQVRQKERDNAQLPMTVPGTKAHLPSQITEEERKEQVTQKENDKAQLCMKVWFILEDEFKGHQGPHLYDPQRARFRNFSIRKTATVAETMRIMAKHLKCSLEQIRPWPLVHRAAKTIRPHMFDLEADLHKSVFNMANKEDFWQIFLELLPANSNLTILPPFNKETDVMLFFKMFDPKKKKIHYCGHSYVSCDSTLNDIVPLLNERAGFAFGTELLLYKEVRSDKIEKLTDFNEQIVEVMEELLDGDIIIFEKVETGVTSDLPTCIDYYGDLFYRINITFIDKKNPSDKGFKMELSLRMTYDQFATAVAQKVGTDPYYLNFFSYYSNYDDPSFAFEGPLKNLLTRNPKAWKQTIYYQQLRVPAYELANRKQFRCIYVDPNMMEQKELILYPFKDGTVDDLLMKAKQAIQFHALRSKKLRLLEINEIRLISLKEDTPLESLPTTKRYRVEEIPSDELVLAEDEMLVSCTHYNKLTNEVVPFGIPFVIKVKHGETFNKVKKRIKNKLPAPEGEWKKIELAIFRMGEPHIPDNKYVVTLNDFKPEQETHAGCEPPWIGLIHEKEARKELDSRSENRPLKYTTDRT